MKCRIQFAVCFILFFMMVAIPSLAAETVVLTYGEWPPYHSSKLPGKGVASIIYEEAFGFSGVKVVYECLPWKRAYEKARHGEATGSVGWLKSGEREKFFFYSDPVMESETVFFYNRYNGFEWNEVEDAKDMRIAIPLGDLAQKTFTTVVKSGSGEIHTTRGYVQGMRMLVAGRVDLFVCNREVGLHILKNRFPDATHVVVHPRPIRKGASHLIISRRIPSGLELMKKFNNGLHWLKESGRYQQILTEYFEEKSGL